MGDTAPPAPPTKITTGCKTTYFTSLFIPIVSIIVLLCFLYIIIAVPVDITSLAYKPIIGGARRAFGFNII